MPVLVQQSPTGLQIEHSCVTIFVTVHYGNGFEPDTQLTLLGGRDRGFKDWLTPENALPGWEVFLPRAGKEFARGLKRKAPKRRTSFFKLGQHVKDAQILAGRKVHLAPSTSSAAGRLMQISIHKQFHGLLWNKWWWEKRSDKGLEQRARRGSRRRPKGLKSSWIPACHERGPRSW